MPPCRFGAAAAALNLSLEWASCPRVALPVLRRCSHSRAPPATACSLLSYEERQNRVGL